MLESSDSEGSPSPSRGEACRALALADTARESLVADLGPPADIGPTWSQRACVVAVLPCSIVGGALSAAYTASETGTAPDAFGFGPLLTLVPLFLSLWLDDRAKRAEQARSAIVRLPRALAQSRLGWLRAALVFVVFLWIANKLWHVAWRVGQDGRWLDLVGPVLIAAVVGLVLSGTLLQIVRTVRDR